MDDKVEHTRATDPRTITIRKKEWTTFADERLRCGFTASRWLIIAINTHFPNVRQSCYAKQKNLSIFFKF